VSIHKRLKEGVLGILCGASKCWMEELRRWLPVGKGGGTVLRSPVAKKRGLCGRRAGLFPYWLQKRGGRSVNYFSAIWGGEGTSNVWGSRKGKRSGAPPGPKDRVGASLMFHSQYFWGKKRDMPI